MHLYLDLTPSDLTLYKLYSEYKDYIHTYEDHKGIRAGTPVSSFTGHKYPEIERENRIFLVRHGKKCGKLYIHVHL